MGTKHSWMWSLVLLLWTGCDRDSDSDDTDKEPKPPVVTSGVQGLTTYGATHTLRGTDLLEGEDGGTLLFEPGPFSFRREDSSGSLSSVILDWQPDQVSFRYPYPASGEVWLETPQGRVSAGSLHTRWQSRPVSRDAGETFRYGTHVDTALLEDDALAAAFVYRGRLGVVRWQGPGAETWELPLDTSDGGLRQLRLLEEPGRPFGALAVGPVEDGGTGLWQLRWEDQTPSLEPTGVATGFSLLVVEEPGGGRAVWVSMANGTIARLREEPDGWSIDRGPVTRPDNDSYASTSLAALGDTLFLSGITRVRSCSLGVICNTTYTNYLWRLDPGATAFVQERTLGTDTSSPAYLVASPYGRLTAYESGYARVRNPDGGPWRSLPSSNRSSSNDQYAELPHGPVLLACDASDEALTLKAAGLGTPSFDDGGTRQTLLWPCPDVLGLELSASGRPLMVIQNGYAGALDSPLYTCEGPADCLAGQACVNGACVCTPDSCAQGCCSGTQCVATPGATACGTGGAACHSCVELGATTCTPEGTCQ